MKRAVIYWLLIALPVVGCAPSPVLVSDRPNRPHDNGKHKGWYKNGRVRGGAGLPPGQAKKRGW